MSLSDVRAVSARQLLDDYRAGATTFFASPSRTILATGQLALGAEADVPANQLARGATELLERYGVPLLLAAVPYDLAGVARVVIPESVQVAAPLDDDQPGSEFREAPRAVADRSWQIGARPDRVGFESSVARAVERIGSGDLAKVVLARSLDLRGGVVDAEEILGRLARHDPHAYTYALELPATVSGASRTLVGASPELLVARAGRRVVARPLAGSAARAADPVEDTRRGAALLASTKDLAEHAFVVNGVVAALVPYCADLVAPKLPTLVRTATMWHLLTEVSGTLVDERVSSLELALALHPTPAVCGTPTAAAYASIEELEAFDRGFYAGVVGWSDAEGNGEWAIALRCAELRDDSIRLYAGAGIVAGSDPASEAAETGAKFRTMLNAMGLEYDA